MPTRRAFLGSLSWPAVSLALPSLHPDGMIRALAAVAGSPALPPETLARDEAFWFEVRQAFDVDRSMINLNNGGVCPSPRAVMASLQGNLDAANALPAYVMWQVQEPRRETAREGLARLLGCDPEEVAITRNASESLETVQLGLDLKRGDEVLATTQDYPRMLTTFRQRERREGIVLKTFPIPVPCEDPAEIVRRFEERITPNTRAILVSHVINLTGQILPVRELCALAARRGIAAIVDGAHAFAHLTFTRDELGCDNYSVSLHKWLLAPIGTGLLYVKRDRIRDVWPLMAAPAEMDANIRKFEEIGTHPAAPALAISDALAFHDGIGPKVKQARLRYLRDTWATRLLAASDRVRLHTSLKPAFSSGLGCVQVEGIPTAKLAEFLWAKHRIFTVAIQHEEFEGLRISPNLYTTLDELDRFGDAVETVIREGVPTA
jgi:selenocysteine lyase/cysteine desulfurase